MSPKEIRAAYKEMKDRWGSELPNFEHEPKRFAWYVKLYKYYKARDEHILSRQKSQTSS